MRGESPGESAAGTSATGFRPLREPSRDPLSADGWRPDVDGLRAVAVLAVIVFHLRRTWLPGGFAGVDVFFVISGYLITRTILSDLAAGSFSRAEFYRRRVKRISLPMLAVVLVTVAAAQVLLLPPDAVAVAWSGIASVLSGANVYFWRRLDRGYFAPGTSEIPLLHLWSLGVEEQFYLLWPWVVPRLVRGAPSAPRGFDGAPERAPEGPDASRRAVAAPATMALLASVAVASFLAGDALFPRAPEFVYYMLPTRAGELLIGAILAFGVSSGVLSAPGRPLREAAGAIGAVLVLGSFALLSEREPFPGWRSVPPTLGAGLLLLAGQGGSSIVSLTLSTAPLVAVGLVSYPAYLWHWPLIAFWTYGHRRVGDAAALGIFAATFALAAASWRWIERPARRTTDSPARVFLRQWVVPGLAVAATAVLAIATGGFGPRLLSRRYVDRLAAIKNDLRPASAFGSVCESSEFEPRFFEADRCENGAPGSKPGVLLWGDSNAAHYVGMLDVLARAAGFRFRNVEVFACPPIFEGPARFAVATRRASCETSSRLLRQRLAGFPVVILAGQWNGYARTAGFPAALFATARSLVAEGHRVILLGQVPPVAKSYDSGCSAKALSFPGLDCPDGRIGQIPPEVASFAGRLRDFAERTPGVSYFDAREQLCPKGRCSAVAEDGTIVYRDPTHLTMPGSIRVGETVLRERGVPPPFDQVPAWLAEPRAPRP